jgi:hypothetical protein
MDLFGTSDHHQMEAFGKRETLQGGYGVQIIDGR